MDSSTMREIWFSFTRSQSWVQAKWTGRVYRAIQKQMNDFAKEYISHVGIAQYHMDKYFDPKPLEVVLMDLVSDVGLRAAKMQHRTTQKGFGSLGIDQAFIDAIIELLGQEFLDIVDNINDTTKKRILQLITEGVNQGQGAEEIARSISGDGIITRIRARVIVRTEVVRSANAGRLEAAMRSKIKLKKFWLSAQDKRTRGNKEGDEGDHLHMNGQEVLELKNPFVDPRSKAELLYPGDPMGGAADTINCRCTLAFEALKDAQGNYIRNVGVQTI